MMSPTTMRAVGIEVNQAVARHGPRLMPRCLVIFYDSYSKGNAQNHADI